MDKYTRIAAMQGGFRAILSNGSILKKAVLQRVRLVNPVMRPLLFSRHESVSSARIEEHGFESTTISDILKDKGKNADGSWLWCTTDDSVYDAVKSVCIFVLTYPNDSAQCLSVFSVYNPTKNGSAATNFS